MKIQIFDVTHGFCAYLVADNGNVMLFDCGHNEKTGFRPSTYLCNSGCNSIEHLIVQNFDQDHLSDLPGLMAKLPVTRFIRNRSLTADQLRVIKEESGPLTNQMEKAIEMHREYVHSIQNLPVFPNIEFVTFHNSYPAFTDTNNLSLVSFVYYDGMGIIFPGDLEKAGWEALLKNTSFCDHLQRVNIFVASHHGRESGYCEEVFEYCKPDIIIISDDEIKYETQEVDYTKHAKGLPWNNSNVNKRYVLTTRSDGMINLEKNVGSGYNITVVTGR